MDDVICFAYSQDVSFSRDGTRVVSVFRDLTLQTWGTVNGVHLDTLRVETPDVVYSENIARSIACSLDAKHYSFSESVAKHVASGGATHCVQHF